VLSKKIIKDKKPVSKLHPDAKKLQHPLIWIDLEMTGLNLEKDRIIEIAVIVTDGALSTVIEGPNLTVRCPEEIINTMNRWCTVSH
jgi:oligoribonuclease